MAYQGDTDRMAGELLNLLKGSLTKPAPGIGARPQAQVDDNSMLSTIKDFLNQSLPGTKPREEQAAPSAPQWGGSATQTPLSTQSAVEVEWVPMYLRQEQERQQLYARHVRERDEIQKRHLKEMESFAGIKKVVVRPVSVRPPTIAAPAARKTARQAGIVPGRTIGNWAVDTENGLKTFTAVSEDQAFREARRYGLTPTTARLVDIHTFTPEELAGLRNAFGRPGMRESMEAEFEQAIKIGLIPENSEFERLPGREWGYRVGNNPIVHKASDLVRRGP